MYLLRLSQPQLSAFLPYIPSYLHPSLLSKGCEAVGCVSQSGLLCAAAVVETPFTGENEWRLSWFFVDEKMREQGVGSLLLAGLPPKAEPVRCASASLCPLRSRMHLKTFYTGTAFTPPARPPSPTVPQSGRCAVPPICPVWSGWRQAGFRFLP